MGEKWAMSAENEDIIWMSGEKVVFLWRDKCNKWLIWSTYYKRTYKKQKNMRSDAFYYDGFGNPCKPEDAWSMSILNYDDSGNFIDSLIAGCNGHSAGDRQVLSINEEIEIIKPWALKIGIGYENVELKGEDDGIRFYTLSSSVLEGKKIGLPVYAIVEDGSPRLLNFREDLYSIAFSL